MFHTTMLRIVGLGLVVLSSVALAQNERVVDVPWPGAPDAGVQETPDIATKTVVLPADPPPMPPSEGSTDAPPPQPPPEPAVDTGPTHTIEAVPPPPPPPEQLDENPRQIPPSGPGAMLDGHPREGAFLSGPGSLTFILHHSLMTGLGVLATQMIPRILDSSCASTGTPAGCTPDSTKWTNQDARVAYLAGSLIGAGIGFGASAWWQFNHWMSPRAANFGIINSFFGGAFLGGIADLASGNNAVAVAWSTVIGNSIAAWLTTVIGGGELPMNKGVLIISGGAWAMIYTGLILAIIATSGGGSVSRGGFDAVMITPAIGAGAMALATLKFNPSTAQILRANVFGVGAGGLVLLVSALVLGANFTTSPVPYILGGVAAIGAKTIVSLLWAEAAENNNVGLAPKRDTKYRSVW